MEAGPTRDSEAPASRIHYDPYSEAALADPHPIYRQLRDEDPLHRLRVLYEMATSPPYSDWARQVPTLKDPNRC